MSAVSWGVILRWLFVLALVLSASPTIVRAGPARDAADRGTAELRAQRYDQAAAAFADVIKVLGDDPDERAAEIAEVGLAHITRLRLRSAVEYAVSRADNHVERIAELHTLHEQLQYAGGDPEIAKLIVDGINLRAAQLLLPHETSRVVTDTRSLAPILKYPQLSPEMRKRYETALERPAKTHRDRAAATRSSLVRRVHQVLEARYTGAALPATTSPELAAEHAKFDRRTVISASADPSCASVLPALNAEARPAGVIQVDAIVRIEACVVTTTSSQRVETYDHITRVPYESYESYMGQTCTMELDVNEYCGGTTTCLRVSRMIPNCKPAPMTRTVTRFNEVRTPRTRTVTDVIVSGIARMRVELRVDGAVTTTEHAIASTVVNRVGPTLEENARDVLKVLLDAPVIERRSARKIALIAEADAALAAGRLDDAEHATVLAILFGGAPPGVFAVNYDVVADLGTVLDAKPVTAAFTKPELLVLAEPKLRDFEKTFDFLQARLASTFPPQHARIGGYWYQAELGARWIPEVAAGGAMAGGQGAPTVAVRLGTPILSRLRSRALGFGVFDDFSAGGFLGYSLRGPDSDARKHSAGAVASYTIAAAYRGQGFAVAAGTRAIAEYTRLAGSHGLHVSTPWFAHAAIAIGVPSLAVEVWAEPWSGDPRRGLMAYYTYRVIGRSKRVAAGYVTSYFGARYDEAGHSRGCVDSGTSCVEDVAWTTRSAQLVFGVGF